MTRQHQPVVDDFAVDDIFEVAEFADRPLHPVVEPHAAGNGAQNLLRHAFDFPVHRQFSLVHGSTEVLTSSAVGGGVENLFAGPATTYENPANVTFLHCTFLLVSNQRVAVRQGAK
jgi:hypothetical protein